MGFQFMHVETYARVSGKGKAGGHTIGTIAAEADRDEDNCPHVSDPKPPIIRYGCSAKEAAILSQNWASEAKDLSGRSLRKDGLCLIAGVISYPKAEEGWENFRDAAENWLKNKYGKRLKSIIEHTDEAHPHIHFYVVPNAGERLEACHQGRAASQKAKQDGKLKGEQNTAYIEAMQAYQDEFSQMVAMPHGLTRLGPKNRRLTRKEWHLEQRQAKFFADAKAVHKSVIKKAAAKGLEQGRAKAEAEREQAIKDAALLAETVGKAVGEFAKTLLSSWHKPTKEAKTQTKVAEESAEKLRIAQKKQEQRFKIEHSTAQAAAKKEIDALKRTNSNIELDLKSAQQTIEQLNAELVYLRRTRPDQPALR